MAEDETEQEPKSPQDSRLTSLDERLRRAERVEGDRKPKPIDSSTVIRTAGLRVAQSLIGMPLGGAIIGWLLDRIFGTAPWIMLALMFIGFAGAVLDVMKHSGTGANKDAGK
ncbi:MAG: AtpZ/AtpI family protein [Sphingomicrobium sp.]|jgi:ATP synthase protein I